MLKNFFILICSVLIIFTVKSQEEYPSLLWKVEGNNLNKPSYLYGTMHVSSKIAFNLGDEFFEALSETEAVGLETNPETWLSFYRDSGLVEASRSLYSYNNSYAPSNSKGFYNSFFEVPEYNLKLFQRFFRPQDRILNQLLYRYNFGQENYEETTYLDMFIFQSAKKEKKPIYSLENFLESYFLAERSNLPDEDEEKKNNYRVGSRNYQKDLETAYLERNLDLLDSMITKNFSKNYRKYLLVLRNENMVNAMDSIMPNKSLFAGVGAAHLPGEDGMIEMLRKKGYKVTPVPFDQSSKASKVFRKIKKSAVDVPLKKYESEDGRIQLLAPGKFYEDGMQKGKDVISSYFLPDYANGAYYGYERLKKVFYGKDFDTKARLNYIDSVLYLITPGEIQKSKTTTVGNFPALIVKTELPRGNHMQLLCVDTPQEILVFKAGGNKSFIRSKNVKNFFDNIKIKDQSNVKEIRKKGFQFDLPEKSIITYNEASKSELIGTDDNHFYQWKYEYLSDFDDLEEDDFELNYLVDQFAEELEYEVEEKEINNRNLSITAKLTDQENDIYVCYYIYHNFYLQFISNAPKEKAHQFFASLQYTPVDYEDAVLKTINDTILNYTVATFHQEDVDPHLVQEFLSLKNDFEKAKSKEDSLDSDFESKVSVKVIKDHITGESVKISNRKVNEYYSLKNGIEEIDERIHLYHFTDSLNYNTVVEEKVVTDTSYKTVYYHSKKGSSRILKQMTYVLDDRIIDVTATVDSTVKPSEFMHQFFKTFAPYSKKQSDRDLTQHQCEKWKNDLISGEYQLEEQAKSSVNNVVFDSLCRQDIETLLLNDTLKILNKELRNQILSQHHYYFREDQNYIEFIKAFYDQFHETPSLQTVALKYMSGVQTEASTKAFMSALEEHPPLISDSYEFYRLFSAYTDSTELLIPILSRLETFALEYEEYMPRIIYLIDRGIYNLSFQADLVSEEFLSELDKRGQKHLRKLSYFQKDKTSKFKEVRDELIEIMSILHSHPEANTKYKTLINLTDTITDPRFKAHVLAKRINRNNHYTPEEVDAVIEDTTHIFPFFEWLVERSNADSIFQAHKVSKELLYHSYLIQKGGYGSDKDTLQFHSVKQNSTYGDSGNVYFYISNNQYDSKKLKAVYFIDSEKPLQLKSISHKSVSYNEDEDDLDEVIQKLMDKVSYSNRPRISEKNNYSYLDYF